jgi:hypothetical protein
MEYKIKKEDIEDIIKIKAEEGFKVLLLEQENLKAQMISQKELLESRTNLLPLNTELLLKHLDILLETVKSFFLASSTIFVASIALDTSEILNIDIPLIINLSTLGLILSIILGIYVLYKRNQEKKEIIRKLSFLDNRYTELSKINHEVLNMTSSKSLEEIKEAVRLTLREDPVFKKHLPDNF